MNTQENTDAFETKEACQYAQEGRYAMNTQEIERLLIRFQNAAFVYGRCLCARCHSLDDFDLAARDFVKARDELYAYVCCFKNKD